MRINNANVKKDGYRQNPDAGPSDKKRYSGLCECSISGFSPDVLALAGAMTCLHCRKMAKMSQGEMALTAEISQSYLSCVESAKSNPSILTLLKAGNAIDMDHHNLLLGYASNIDIASELRKNFLENREECREYKSFREYGCHSIRLMNDSVSEDF